MRNAQASEGLPCVVYTLGEVCAWSIDSDMCEHRYVDVTVSGHSHRNRRLNTKTTLELPTTEALHLCLSMGSNTHLEQLLEVRGNGWVASMGRLTLPAIAQLLSQYRGYKIHSLKEVDLRINLTTGDWKLLSKGQTVLQTVLQMLGICPEHPGALVHDGSPNLTKE